MSNEYIYGLIAYTLFSLFFGGAAWAIVRGGSERRDHDVPRFPRFPSNAITCVSQGEPSRSDRRGKGASDDRDNTAGAAEGAFPADRFRSE